MYEIKGKGLLQIIIILCSMSAPFIGAYSWILMLGNSGIIRKAIKSVLGITLPSIYGFNGILLVLSLQLFPLVFLYVSGAMKNIDNSLLEAAESMGCKGIKAFSDRDRAAVHAHHPGRHAAGVHARLCRLRHPAR